MESNSVQVLGEETSLFIEEQLKSPSQYGFVNTLLKGLKKQLFIIERTEKVIAEQITVSEFEESLKTENDVAVKFKGFFVSGEIDEVSFCQLLSLFDCNVLPRVDIINNSLLYSNSEFRLFVSGVDEKKNIAILFSDKANMGSSFTSVDIKTLLTSYYKTIDVVEMQSEDIIKLSYDISELDYKGNYSDINTGLSLYDVQDALVKLYGEKPFDVIFTITVVYRLKNAGFSKEYIDLLAKNNRKYNISNSQAHIILNSLMLENLLTLGFIDSNYGITETGRAVMATLNYALPVSANNFSNYYATLSYIILTNPDAKDKLVKLASADYSLYGIKDEFYVDEKCLLGYSKKIFAEDEANAASVINAVDKTEAAKAVGFVTNLYLDEDAGDLNLGYELFNELLNAAGGFIIIKPYQSGSVKIINSLIYRLVEKAHGNISAHVSTIDDDFVVLKNKDLKVVATLKAKSYLLKKEFMGVQDLQLLHSKVSSLEGFVNGLSVADNIPVIFGEGYVEIAEISKADFEKLLDTQFTDLRGVLAKMNTTDYFSELDVEDILDTIISKRSKEYDEFKKAMQSAISKKVSALEILLQHFTIAGNEEKKIYYADLVADWSAKSTNYKL